MSYTVRVECNAQIKLLNIPSPYYEKLKAAILNLGAEPRPNGYKKWRERNSFRIRVSDYRIIYEMFDEIRIVDIIDVGHRKDMY